MADSDPDLAASLLAAFSAPTALKADAPSETAPAPEPVKQEPVPPTPPPQQLPPQEPLKQEPPQPESNPQRESTRPESTQPQSTQSENTQPEVPRPAVSQQQSPPPPPRQDASQQRPSHELRSPSQVDSSQGPSQEGPAPPDTSQQGPLSQSTLPPQEIPQLHLPPDPSQYEPMSRPSQQSQPLTAPEQPTSPQKRGRSPTPVAHDHGSIAEKRLKTDHHDLDHRDIDLSAANWDISAMIENALGSFDQQAHQPHADPEHGSGEGLAAEFSQAKPQMPRRTEQKRMKFSSNPYYVMRTMSLPLLGSLAIQVLLALSQQSREETLALMADDESEFRKAYDTLKTALGHARRIFAEGSPLLFADELDISDSEDRETIRMSNLATVSASAFALDGALLADVHDNFPTIFVPEEGDFVKDLKPLYLDFKTQAMLTALITAHNPQERSDVLDRFFPPNFDELLTQRHGDSLFQSNREDLVAEVGTRRQALLESILDDGKRQRLKDEYPVNGFLDNLVDYLQSHLTMVIDYAEKYGINIPVSEDSVVNEPLEDEGHDELAALLQSATSKLMDGMDMDGHAESLSDSLGLGKLIQDSLQSQSGPVKDEPAEPNGHASALLESGGLASLIASKLTDFDQFSTQSNVTPNEQHHGLPNVANGSMQSPYLAQYNHVAQSQYYPYGQIQHQPAPAGDGSTLPPNQTFPTSVLYERARQAAVAKSSSAARREGIHSTRRAWTPEEEKALMMGLDMVKGPHWSQILSLFGANGSVSDILKDRTQVQLKDKARNLKLFFLKTNSEMPYYLQCVTGELKTRAPGQAARKEAEEKARQNSEEEHARLQGILTLAGGLQHNHQPVNHSNLNNHHAASSPVHPSQGTPAYARSTPMTPQTTNASMARGMVTPTAPHTTLAPGAPSMLARAPNMQNYAANMATAAPRTPSMSTATSHVGTGAPVTPNGGAGEAAAAYSSTSAPPMPGTAVTTPASSPVKVKSEPQEQPVLIQPRPAPQPLRPAEPVRTFNPNQQPQSAAAQPPQQVKAMQAAPQPLIQLSFPPDPSPAPRPAAEQTQATEPARAPAPAHVQHAAQHADLPHQSTAHTTLDSHLAREIAQLANYQPPEGAFGQQQHQQPDHYRHDSHTAAHTNGHQHSNEHDDNHEQHVHHDSEPNADLTLLQTLQAALAAAPSG